MKMKQAEIKLITEADSSLLTQLEGCKNNSKTPPAQAGGVVKLRSRKQHLMMAFHHQSYQHLLRLAILREPSVFL